MKSYRNALELARAVFKRDIRPNLSSSFSAIFLGKLRIILECDDRDQQYTYLKKPGVAVIHLGLGAVCRYAVDNPSNPIPPNQVEAYAKRIKTFIIGYAYHEIGHLLFTDMTGGALKSIDIKYNPFLGFIKDVLNVMEDPKMERLMSKDIIYKFSKPYFGILTKAIFAPQAKKYKDNGTVADLLNYLLLWLRCGPKALAGHNNAMFDSLVPKGIYDKIRECHRENDAMERARKQVAFAIWLVDELGIKAKDVGQRTTQDRPVIIIVDKTPGGQQQQKPLMPKDMPLPPVSIAEVGDEEDGDDEDGEQPDADIIDARKNKPEPKEEDDESSESGKGDSSDEGDEDEGDGDDPKGSESKQKPSKSPSKPQKSDEPDEGDDAEWGDEGEDDGVSDEGDEDGEEESCDEEDGDDGEDGESQSSQNQDSDSKQSTAGHENGPKSKPSVADKDFDWEFGAEDPIEAMAEAALDTAVDADLDTALTIDSESEDRSQEYDAKVDFEVTDPDTANKTFERCAESLGFMPAALADVIKELKAESEDIDLHYLSDGEEIDLDDYLDIKASGTKSLDVYRDDIKGREITDLAVSVLVDCSGSMGGQPSMFAYSASVLVALACEEAEVPCELAAFSTRGVLYVKHFNEEWSDCRETIGMLCSEIAGCYDTVSNDTIYLWGGTELEEALPIVLGNLRKYEEKQAKLLFVITDGDTGDVRKTGEFIQAAREEGIVVIGIGVGTSESNLRECFDHCCSFSQSSIAKLPEYVAHEIEEAIASNNFSGY